MVNCQFISQIAIYANHSQTGRRFLAIPALRTVGATHVGSHLARREPLTAHAALTHDPRPAAKLSSELSAAASCPKRSNHEEDIKF